MPTNPDISMQWLAERWTAGLSQAIRGMADADCTLSIQGEAEPEPGVQPAWWRQELDIVPGPAIWIGAGPEAHQELARRLLAQAGIQAPAEKDIRDTWTDLLAQAGQALAESIGERCGASVNAGPMEQGTLPRTAVPIFATVGLQGTKPFPIGIAFSPELVARIAPRSAVESVHEKLAQAGLDVQLNMVVTLGRTTLPLGDVFRLSTGAIIEFPQTIAEPAEIWINSKLVAHGQVVVTDGNYAVKLVSTAFEGQGDRP